MMAPAAAAGRFAFPGSELSVNRMGYGAMQLPGKGVWGPPADRAEALAVLRTAVEHGVDHIDTSDYYGPRIANELIREALSPYPEGLVIVSKIGARRGDDGSWLPAFGRDELIEAVEGNLERLGLDSLDIVNLRVGIAGVGDEPLGERLDTAIELRERGLVRYIGISNVSRVQVEEALAKTDIVCVQNHYNLAHRQDDALIDELAERGIAYVPYFPLGGFSPLQSEALDEAAAEIRASPMQVALAWLLRRSPNILLIPGTSSRKHLLENLAAAELELPEAVAQRLDGIAS